MIVSFLHQELKHAWEYGKPFTHERLTSKLVFQILDVIEASEEPSDVAFFGQFYEWSENGKPRFGIQVTDHWTITFGWSAGNATELDLEWHN